MRAIRLLQFLQHKLRSGRLWGGARDWRCSLVLLPLVALALSSTPRALAAVPASVEPGPARLGGAQPVSSPGPASSTPPSQPDEAALSSGPANQPISADPFAESFELGGLVDRPRRFTRDDLLDYPTITLTVAYGSGQGFEQGTFSGVLLWDLLQEAGSRVDPTRRNDRLRKYVVATGSDGYEAVFSLAELDPEFGAEVVLVAHSRDGQPLGPREGMARIVIGTDKRGGRLVSNLVRIEVRDVDSPPRSAGS